MIVTLVNVSQRNFDTHNARKNSPNRITPNTKLINRKQLDYA